MAVEAKVSGRFVSAFERSYDFKDKETGKPVSGTTRLVWVLAEDGAVERIRFGDDNASDFHSIAKQYSFGDVFEAKVFPQMGDKPHGFLGIVAVPKGSANSGLKSA